MSVERQARRLVRTVAIYRLIGAFTELPVRLCNVVVALFQALGYFLKDIDQAIFYRELDAARQYRALTGVDLGIGAGEVWRYSGLAEDAAERRDQAAREQGRT